MKMKVDALAFYPNFRTEVMGFIDRLDAVVASKESDEVKTSKFNSIFDEWCES